MITLIRYEAGDTLPNGFIVLAVSGSRLACMKIGSLGTNFYTFDVSDSGETSHGTVWSGVVAALEALLFKRLDV